MTAAIPDYPAAIDFLYGRTDYELVPAGKFRYEDLKLARMRRLLNLLGNPQDHLPTVHVAGTKGKGSTATMIASILSAGGIRTGLFTSPHLTHFEERIRLDRNPIPPPDVIRHVRALADAAETMRRDSPSQPPTFFELTTALAWLWFAERRADIVVLETGLGGRLDSTNVCRPLLTLITCIGLDHTQQLGNTIGQIAAEKAGIFKQGVPAFSGASAPEACRVIREAARRCGADLKEVDSASTLNSYSPTDTGACWNVESGGEFLSRVELPVAGKHQGHNLALALAAIDELRRQGRAISESAVRAGLRGIELPARQEVFAGPPPVLLDSCHNSVSMAALAETLAHPPYVGRRKILLFASSRDKDVNSQFEILRPHVDAAVFTEHRRSPRAMRVEELESIARDVTEWPFECVRDAAGAFDLACRRAREGDVVVAAGSFYLAGELRELLLAQKNDRQPANA